MSNSVEFYEAIIRDYIPHISSNTVCKTMQKTQEQRNKLSAVTEAIKKYAGNHHNVIANELASQFSTIIVNYIGKKDSELQVHFDVKVIQDQLLKVVNSAQFSRTGDFANLCRAIIKQTSPSWDLNELSTALYVAPSMTQKFLSSLFGNTVQEVGINKTGLRPE